MPVCGISKIYIAENNIAIDRLALGAARAAGYAGGVCRNSFTRFCEAAARWIILAVHPIALTGKVSI